MIALRRARAERGGTAVQVLLSGVVGATAHGLAHAGSDLDRLGVHAVPTVELLGLHRPRTDSPVTTRPDRTLYEAATWCRPRRPEPTA